MKPNLVVWYKAESLTASGVKTDIGILVEGNPVFPLVKEDLLPYLREGIVNLKTCYGTPKAQTLLDLIKSGGTPQDAENWNYSVNTALRTYSKDWTNTEGVDREGRNGFSAGVIATYQDGHEVFMPMDMLLYVVLGKRTPVNVYGKNIKEEVDVFFSVPFNDELGLNPGDSIVYTLGINHVIAAPALTLEYLVVQGMENINTLGAGAWKKHIENGTIISKERVTKNETEVKYASVQEYLAQGYVVQKRYTDPCDIRALWLDYILFHAGVFTSTKVSNETAHRAFTPLPCLAQEVFGIECQTQTPARKTTNRSYDSFKTPVRTREGVPTAPPMIATHPASVVPPARPLAPARPLTPARPPRNVSVVSEDIPF